MTNLCAPSTMSIDDELRFLYKEQKRLEDRITQVVEIQNQETGITPATMNKALNYMIECAVDNADRDTIQNYVEYEIYNMSYKDVIRDVENYYMNDEPCFKKMLKEHADHILLKG